MTKTKIQWTEYTWNPTVGCSIHSPGCTHCYAMREAHRLALMGAGGEKYKGLTEMTKAGPVFNGVVRLYKPALDQPLRWKRPRRIFVNSMSDLFHESLPDEAIDKVFTYMALAHQHTFQVLTKRADRMRAYTNELARDPGRLGRHMDPATQATTRILHQVPLPNVWLGVSTEDQKRADERIPDLLNTPAAVRWISAEPLLELLDIAPWKLDWVVAGGESGPRARPSHPGWFRSLRDQCQDAGFPFFFKQWGEWVSVSEVAGEGPHHTFPDGATVRRVGKAKAGNTLDGRTHLEWPQ